MAKGKGLNPGGEKVETAPGPKLTSIVIVAWNQLPYTKLCIESIQKYTDVPYELVLVDNGSTDGTGDYFASLPNATVIKNPVNLGFAAGCNQGIKAARGDYVLLLNNDTVVSHNWLSNLINCLESSPDIGIVGPVSNYVSGVQLITTHYRSLEEMHEFARQYNRPDPSRWFDTDRLVGFCMLIRRSVIDRIGLLDESFGLGTFEDDDYCLRARQAGFRLVCAGDTFVHHFGSKTFAGNNIDMAQLLAENRAKFCRKWGLETPESGAPVERELKEKLEAVLQARAWLACEEVVAEGAAAREKILQAKRRLKKPKGENLRITYLVASTGVTGAARIIFEQANRLAERGHQVSLVSHYNPPEWFPLKPRFIQVPLRARLSDYVPASDIVIATFWAQIPELCRLAEKSFLSYLVQGDLCFLAREKLTPHQRLVIDELHKLPVSLIVVSRYLQRLMRELYGRESYYVPNAVDHHFFFPRARTPREKKRILVMGADQLFFKGVQDIALALQLLARKGVEFSVTWITPVPPEFARPGWEVIVNPTREELARIMADCDIYISGSHYEAFSLPPLEAMASGVAVVTTANEGVKEYARDGYNCLMVPVGDPEAMAEAIRRLMTDERLYATLVANGLKTAQQYTWDRTVASLEEVLWKIIREEGADEAATGAGVFSAVSEREEPLFASGYYHHQRPELVALVPQQARRVLDVGCAAGMMGAALKERGVAEVVGVEINPVAAREAATRLDKVIVGDIEEIELTYPEGYFDTIVLGDVLEHLRDPWNLLKRLRRYLAEGGKIVASIPNVAHISVIRDLIRGEWRYADIGILDRTHLRFFTLSSIREMFANAGYRITSVAGVKGELNPEERELVNFLRSSRVAPPTFAEEAPVIQYLVVAEKVALQEGVSLCVAVSPAEDLVRRLAGLEKIVKEVILVGSCAAACCDTIAVALGVAVHHIPGSTGASWWREACAKATGKWLLFLGPGEQLVAADALLLRAVVAAGTEGYYLTGVLSGLEQEDTGAFGPVFRLFRNDARFYATASTLEEVAANIQRMGGEVGFTPCRVVLCSNSKWLPEREDSSLYVLEKEAVARPKDGLVRFSLGFTRMLRGDYQRALPEFQMAFQNSAHEPDLRALIVYDIASCLAALGRLEEALRVLEDAIAVYPDLVDFRFLQGSLWAKTGNYPEAARSYRECIEKQKTGKAKVVQPGVGSYQAGLALGKLYETRGYWEGAVQAYSSALTSEARKNPWLLRRLIEGLGRVLIGREDTAAIKAFFERHFDTQEATVLALLSQIFLRNRQYAAALEYAERALSQAPTLPEAILAKGEALLGLGQLREAEGLLQRVPAESEGFLTAQLDRVFCRLLRGDFPGAREILATLEKNPHWQKYTLVYRDFTAVLSGGGKAFSTGSVPAEDTALYRELALDILGKLLALGEFEKFERALPLLDFYSPGERALCLGKLYFTYGFKESAAEELLQALACGTGDAAAFGMLGEIAAEKGLLEDAVVFYTHALSLNKYYLPFYTGLARVLAQLGRREEALALLGEVREEFPESPYLREVFAEVERVAARHSVAHL